MKSASLVVALRACLAATRRPFGTGSHEAPPPANNGAEPPQH